MKSRLQIVFERTYELSGPNVDLVESEASVRQPEIGVFPKARVVEPYCNIVSQSLRFSVLEPTQSKQFLPHFFSIVLHILSVTLAVVVSHLGPSSVFLETVPPMEIAWGLDVESAQLGGELPSEAGKFDEENEATKDKQLLPQLPKQFEIETVQPKEVTDVPLPEVLKDEEVEKRPEQKSEDKPDKEIQKKDVPIVALENPKKNVKKISAKELQERKDKEKRTEAEKTKEGAKTKSNSDGKKSPPSDIPPAPSLASKTSGGGGTQTKGGTVNAGDPNSSSAITGPEEEYRAILKNHVLRNWNLASVSNFEEDLKVQVVVVLNAFGRLVQAPQVFKSSGNEEFDTLALQAVKGSEPYPEPSEGTKLKRIVLNLQPSKSERE